MQISSRFTIAIHILTCIETFKKDFKITSDFLASSINVNPVIVRNILGQLKKAGLVTIQRGSGGADIAKPAKEISFHDIFTAVDSVKDNTLFNFHENPNPACPVGKNIHNVLDNRLLHLQSTFEDEMKKITLDEVIKDTASYIRQESK